MHDEYFFIDAMANGQVAEKLREEIIHLHIILLLYFTFKAIKLIKVLRFMIASGHKHVLRISSLPSKKGDDDLNREGTSVNEISIEEIGIGLRGITIDLEDV